MPSGVIYSGREGRCAGIGSFTEPVVRFLSRTPITPSTITWFGFLLTVGAAALIITGHLLVAGLVVLIAGFFDILD